MNNTLSNNTQEYDPVSVSTKRYQLLLTTCIIAVFAIVQHTVILFLTSMDKTLRQKSSIVSILLLSTTDVLLSAALLLFMLVNLATIQQTWICGLTHFILQLGWVSSMLHTLVICTERYLASRPIQSRTFIVRKRRILTVMIFGICSVIVAIPYLFTVREATLPMLPCSRLNLFQDNWPYGALPVRFISILIWMCTVLIYILTVKNLVYALQRSNRIRGGYFRQNSRFTSQGTTHDRNTSKSHFSKGKTDMGASGDVSTETKRPVRTSENNAEEIDTSTNVSDIITLHANCVTVEAHQSAHIQDSVHGNEQNENKLKTDKPGNTSIITQQSLFSNESNITQSCSRAVNLRKERQSRPPHQKLEVKAFRIVSVVFLVFFVTMAPRCLAGLVGMFHPVSQTVDWFCDLLALSSILTHPVMYAFLLKDFRNKLRCK